MSLSKLIEAVERGDADFDWGFAASPSRKALPENWHDAMNAYLGSLDAAKRLHDALLPEYGYHLGGWGARVWLYSDRPHWDGSNRQEVEMPNAPARAWLLAVLKALENQHEK